MNISARLPVRVVVRLVSIAPVLAALTLVGSANKLGPSIGGCAQASTTHHAALVVEHSDGSGHGVGPVITVCISFAEDSIHGDALLARSGVRYATGDSGAAVCQIDNEPAQFQPQCLSAGTPYWEMFVSRGGGSWTYSSLGFSSQTFRDGDAEGFRFEGQSDGTTPPSPSGVCPVASTAGTVPTRPTTPVPHSTGVPASGTTSGKNAPASSVPPAPATAPASSLPGQSASATAHPAASIVSSNRSAPLSGGSTGAWVAGALGGLLTLGLALQLARVRGRSPQRPPP